MTSKSPIKLFYIHDPMCSWCYAGATTFSNLYSQLDPNISIVRLLGGLAIDTDEPMPLETQTMVKGAWQRIEKSVKGVSFNFDFWDKNIPRRSTYLACRAVIAAREQDELYDQQMTQAIQEAYYQQAQNPSDISVLSQLAKQLGLNVELFNQSINSKKTQTLLLSEIQMAKNLKVDSFPSLVLQQSETASWIIPIDYNDAEPMLETITLLLED